MAVKTSSLKNFLSCCPRIFPLFPQCILTVEYPHCLLLLLFFSPLPLTYVRSITVLPLDYFLSLNNSLPADYGN